MTAIDGISSFIKPGFHIGDFKAKRLHFAMRRRRLEHFHFGNGDAPGRRFALAAPSQEVHHAQLFAASRKTIAASRQLHR